MKLAIRTIALCLWALPTTAAALPTEAELLRSALRESLSKVCEIKNTPIGIQSMTGLWIVEESLLGCGVSLAADAKKADTAVVMNDLAVRYHPTDDSEILIRTARVEATLVLQSPSAKIPITRLAAEHTDTLARSSVDALRSPELGSLVHALPEKPKSLWDEALEPIVVVSSIALTVFLLFSVRTR